VCRCKCGKKVTTHRQSLLKGRIKSCGCRGRLKYEAAKLDPGTRFGRLVVQKYITCQKVRCKCDCGLNTTTSKNSLIKGHTKSCGCLRSPRGVFKAGRRFGKLTVLKDKGYYDVECRCDCGTKVELSRERLLRKGSCGCFKRRFNRPLREGRRFGRLEVLQDASHRAEVICVCDCGYLTITHRASLIGGSTKSCGCLRFDTFRLQREGTPGVVVSSRGYYIKKGTVFGSLTVLEDSHFSTATCSCVCEKTVMPDRCALLKGKIKSCGCSRGRLLNTPLKQGTKFKRLVVLEDRGPKAVFCLCACGKRKILHRERLIDGHDYCCGSLVCANLKPLKKGEKIRAWTVVEQDGELATCRCACGEQCFRSVIDLRTGAAKHCGKCSKKKDTRSVS
jgi:hypothetical protein